MVQHRNEMGAADRTPGRGGPGARIDVEALKAEVGDRWVELLSDLAQEELGEACAAFPQHVACPIHGGRDGFRLFNDAEETGGGVCNTCGAFSDGIALLMKVKGWSFPESVAQIEAWVGENGDEQEEDEQEPVISQRPIRRSDSGEPNKKGIEILHHILDQASTGHERITAYYRSRGLTVEPPETLAHLESLLYHDPETGFLNLPVMVGIFQAVSEEMVAVFRTYLDPDGDGKAQVPKPKKCTSPIRKGATTGAAIRLRDPVEVLGVAEGIETAEAVFQATGVPTWATCAANRLEKVEIPATVQEVHIWGDRDAGGVGQLAASKLAERMIREGRRVKLLLPPEIDKDWLDVLVESGEGALLGAFGAEPYLDNTFDASRFVLPRPAPAVPPSGFVAPIIVDRDGDPVMELNRKHFIVSVGGKTYIATEAIDPESGYVRLEFGEQRHFNLRYSGWCLSIDGKQVPATKIWLGDPNHRQYEGLVFSPRCVVPWHYNLWRGFAVEAIRGDCSMFWDHLRRVICRGVSVHYEYVRKWLAHLIQKPAEIPGVALVIRGMEGTGKTIFVDFVGALLGQHYLMLTQMEQLTGKFTGHLEDALLVCANEAVWGGNKQGEGALKSMITDRFCIIEPKGKDLFQVSNYKRLIVTTNERWAVPMGMQDRRFLVLETGDQRIGDRTYFVALDRQMRQNGGLQALMHELMNEDLTSFEVRTKPQSPHGFDIKIRSAEPFVRWWFETLHSGVLHLSNEVLETHEWSQTPGKDQLYACFASYCEAHHLRKIDKPLFGKELRKMIPGWEIRETRPSGGDRPRSYVLPTIEECREAFQCFASAGAEIWEE